MSEKREPKLWYLPYSNRIQTGVKNEFIYLDNKLLVNARSAPATKIRWRACAFGPWSGAVFDQFQASSTTDGVDIFRVGGGEGDHEMVSI